MFASAALIATVTVACVRHQAVEACANESDEFLYQKLVDLEEASAAHPIAFAGDTIGKAIRSPSLCADEFDA